MCAPSVDKIASSTDAPTRRTPAKSVDTQADEPQFDWLSHWYPVNVVETLDPTKPHPTQLLGKNLVIWNDGPTVDGEKVLGDWHVFEDACPHRLGPLSEGRVEADGNLLCSYHGWRFDGQGDCADLPYAMGPSPERQRTSCRATCGAFPTKVVDGLIWVFPRSGLAAFAESETVPMPLIKELRNPERDGDWRWRIPAGVRDFPCGWDGMAENTLDPAHFCAAHHGTLGNRYTDPAPYAFETTRPLSKEEGFACRGDFGVIEFVPPCLVIYKPDYQAMPFGGGLVIATYCVPTRPGWVRPLANVINDASHPSSGTIAEFALGIFMAGLTPSWLGHILSSIVLHQDSGLLYKQYRNLRERGYNPGYEAYAVEEASATEQKGDLATSSSTSYKSPTSYEKLVYTPTSVDSGVMLFRKWLWKHAGGGVPWHCKDVVPARGTEDIYDMWEGHCKHCQYCQDAYRNLELARYTSLAVCGAGLLAMEASPERTALVLVSGAIAAGLNQFNDLFRRYEFAHADNDPWWMEMMR